jgi:SprT protein
MSSLSNSELSQMLGQATPQQAEAINAKVAELMEIANTKLQQFHYTGKLPLLVPEMKYDLKGTTAGQACARYKMGTNPYYYVRLNLKLLHKHWEYLFNQTLPHEVAHTVVQQVWPSAKSHGSQWKMVCTWFGIVPHRTHDLPATPARKRKPRTNAYYCSCAVDNEHLVSDLIHKRIGLGRRYHCTRCGALLKREG